jgi:hypothetical protein
MTTAETMTRLQELDKAVKLDTGKAGRLLGRQEARFLVDAYYQIQDNRKRSDAQSRTLAEAGEPHTVIDYLGEMSREFETMIKGHLNRYSKAHPVGAWSREQKGIGPVTASGLLAHIDIERAPTAGHIWRFAGLDPTVEWKKGEKRPWNAKLKVVCFHIGESFVKIHTRPDAYYGDLWAQRKAWETEQNEAGKYADAAVAKLEKFKIGKDTEAYKHYSAGRLPPAHVHARSKRWVVKLFLSHWHHVAYQDRYGKPPPRPYVIEHMNHVDLTYPPGWEAMSPD